MCTSCVTNADAIFWNGAFAGSMALGVLGRVRDRFRGRSPVVKRRETWEANATFVESLGLDATEVLGPPPAGRAPSPDEPALVTVP